MKKPKQTFVYALDISLSSTGVAIFTNNGKYVECSSIDTTKEKDLREKLVMIGKAYKECIKKYVPSIVIMEQGFSKYNISTQMIFRCIGVTNYIFSKYEQVVIPSTTIKKLITGKGNAKKQEVRDFILKDYPNIKFQNFDESDAYAVGLAFFIQTNVIKWDIGILGNEKK